MISTHETHADAPAQLPLVVTLDVWVDVEALDEWDVGELGELLGEVGAVGALDPPRRADLADES
jgi:hypothetical protein